MNWRDSIYLAGFSTACSATRACTSSLIIPDELLVTQRVEGLLVRDLRRVGYPLVSLAGDLTTLEADAARWINELDKASDTAADLA